MEKFNDKVIPSTYEYKSVLKNDTKPDKFNINFLPELIIENDIFGYLNSKELFFSVRPVCIKWSVIMKNLWCTKIKEEMIDQVKTIDFIYEKEVLTKTYEFKIKYLINYRTLLNLYNSNTNVLLLIKNLITIENFDNQIDLIMLLRYFFEFFQMSIPKYQLEQKEYENIDSFLGNEDHFNDYRNMFSKIIDVENFHDYGEDNLNILKDNFLNTVDKNKIDEINDNSKLIYSLLHGLIEYESLKFDVKHLREKIECLISRIQATTDEWPKKKRFFERAYKLLLYTK